MSTIALPLPRRQIGGEPLILLAGAYWALALNRPFFAAVLHAAPPHAWAGLPLVIGLALALTALHALLLGLAGTRRTLKPLIALLTLAGAVAMHYIQRYGVVIDPTMLRNALHTDAAEARELLTARLAFDLLLYAALPIALLSRVRVARRPWRRALRRRALLLAGAFALLALGLAWQFQPLAAFVRNHKEARYLLTPLNAVWSLGRAAAADARGAARAREAIGLDAAPAPSWAAHERPRLVVLVVGETARAANWGLSGYGRATTPALAQLPVINFDAVVACGTSTEVSLPCMFAPVGRRDYDEARIRGQESLLHVVARAGVQVLWRDNQSGCKGVCDGLPTEHVAAAGAPEACRGGRCLDEALLRGLDERLLALRDTRAVQLLVLHMLGNHGPSYFRRYPPAFEHFTPACRDDDLGRCTREEIVNAYDNALRYTDHVLATLIGVLSRHAGRVDSALLFVSDHGESLGENRLYLHGVPYAIAPKEQTQVPMVMWSSEGFARAAALDPACLKRRARQPVQHDHLFHTLLGLLEVRTALYDARWDFARDCTGAAHRPAPMTDAS